MPCINIHSRGECGIPCVNNIGGTDLKAVDRIRDLGVIITPSLSPYKHIIAKATSILAFICRTTRDFKSPADTKCIVQILGLSSTWAQFHHLVLLPTWALELIELDTNTLCQAAGSKNGSLLLWDSCGNCRGPVQIAATHIQKKVSGLPPLVPFG